MQWVRHIQGTPGTVNGVIRNCFCIYMHKNILPHKVVFFIELSTFLESMILSQSLWHSIALILSWLLALVAKCKLDTLAMCCVVSLRKKVLFQGLSLIFGIHVLGCSQCSSKALTNRIPGPHTLHGSLGKWPR